jgi:endonuclease YncB( thermonuclease family)
MTDALRRTLLTLILIPLLMAAKPVWLPNSYGPYQAEYLSTLDGDTFWARIHIYPSQSVAIKVRVLGVDTPEFRSSAYRKVPACEKVLAEAARAFTSDFLGKAATGQIWLEQVKPDKYGDRVDANVWVAGNDLAQELIKAGHGRPYSGETRQPWCVD